MIILYPTETVYGLGVRALDPLALERLYELKGRKSGKAVSWLVRDLEDIRKYAEVNETAAKIAEQFLPGPLTLILKAKSNVPKECISEDGTVSFRISTDLNAQRLAEELGEPITCTSANVSGLPPLETPKEILAQFGDRAHMIDQVIDDGPRSGTPSTVVRIIGDTVEVLREGSIPQEKILKICKK